MNPEHVQVVKKGIIAIEEWNNTDRGEQLDLSGADLTEVDFTEADLSGADSHCSILHKANLVLA